MTVAKIVVDPNVPTTAYAAVDDNGYNGSTTGESGIYKTTNGGQTWVNTTAFISTDSIYSDLVINPSNPSILYMAIGGPTADVAGGIYESTDAGSSWTLLAGAPAGVANGRIALAISPSSPQTIYAAYSNNNVGGNAGSLEYVMVSTDGGASWSNMAPQSVNPLSNFGNNDIAITVNPTDPSTVYLGGFEDPTLSAKSPYPLDGILETTNGGNSWTDVSIDDSGNGPLTGYHALTFNSAGTAARRYGRRDLAAPEPQSRDAPMERPEHQPSDHQFQ